MTEVTEKEVHQARHDTLKDINGKKGQKTHYQTDTGVKRLSRFFSSTKSQTSKKKRITLLSILLKIREMNSFDFDLYFLCV